MKFLDIFFTVFHTSLVLFILFGWIWKKTRLPHLIVVILTAGSWLILGIFYGLGYCPFTDWHFTVLEKLGHTNLPSSYISFLVIRITGLKPNQTVVDVVTTGGLILGIAGNIILMWRFRIKKGKQAIVH
jgi:hypothetical protein